VLQRAPGRRVNWAPRAHPRELRARYSVEAALWLLMAQIGERLGSCGWLVRWSLRSMQRRGRWLIDGGCIPRATTTGRARAAAAHRLIYSTASARPLRRGLSCRLRLSRFCCTDRPGAMSLLTKTRQDRRKHLQYSLCTTPYCTPSAHSGPTSRSWRCN
jgi:hypothetical protein